MSAMGDLPSPEEVSALLQNIASIGSTTDVTDGASRRALLAAARSLTAALETPMEAVLRMSWAEGTLRSYVCIALDIKLFEAMADRGGGSKTCTELATAISVDSNFLSRILKHFAAMNFIVEDDADTYSPTRLSNSMLDPKHRDGMPFFFKYMNKAMISLPENLAKNGYKNPSDPYQTAWQMGHQTPLHIFAWMQEHPDVFDLFNNHMMGKVYGRKLWTDPGCVDVEGLLGKDLSTDEGATLLVDIGGGVGHDLVDFEKHHSAIPGRLILQDLDTVISTVGDFGPSSRIQTMSHDFFTPQPIIGAKAYYLNSILHDWPNDKCEEILKNIIPAMKKGYSKILINEYTIPAKGAYWQITAVDALMMTAFASLERTEKQWGELLKSVGLRMIEVITFEEGMASIVVAELV